MSQELAYGNTNINIGEHKVEGTVNLPLAEVDRLRGAIINRDNLIADLKEKQKKVKITLRQKEVTRIYDRHYEEYVDHEKWGEVHSYKNLDDIMDGLKATVKKEIDEIYGNDLENANKEVDRVRERLTKLKIKFNTTNEELNSANENLSTIEEELKEEKSKNSGIKEEFDTMVRLKDKLEKDLEMSRNRELKLRDLLDSETFLGRLSKFFGVK